MTNQTVWNPKGQSKLSYVMLQLKENPDVVVVHSNQQVLIPDRDGYWSHKVTIIVAPKAGLYTAKELQGFMLGLISGLESSCKDDFWSNEVELSLGKLYFDEKIGEESISRICTITDPDLLQTVEMDGDRLRNVYGLDEKGQIKFSTIEDYLRRTWVKPYPSEKVAKDVLEGLIEGSYRLSEADLLKYKSEHEPGLLKRIFSRKKT